MNMPKHSEAHTFNTAADSYNSINLVEGQKKHTFENEYNPFTRPQPSKKTHMK